MHGIGSEWLAVQFNPGNEQRPNRLTNIVIKVPFYPYETSTRTTYQNWHWSPLVAAEFHQSVSQNGGPTEPFACDHLGFSQNWGTEEVGLLFAFFKPTKEFPFQTPSYLDCSMYLQPGMIGQVAKYVVFCSFFFSAGQILELIRRTRPCLGLCGCPHKDTPTVSTPPPPGSVQAPLRRCSPGPPPCALRGNGSHGVVAEPTQLDSQVADVFFSHCC